VLAQPQVVGVALDRERHSMAAWPFTPDAINRLIKRIGARARFAFRIHAHMLRHACGYALANAGHDTRRIQDWLGHRSIQHTTRYTQLSAAPFKDFWR
jgi:site-specific recombinase XerD